MTGGTERGWPVRGSRQFVLERLEWTGKMPFEIERITIRPGGFRLQFTMAVAPIVAAKTETYELIAYTHIYRKGYGSPEVDKSKPRVTAVIVADDRMSVRIEVDGMIQGHVHEFDLKALRSVDGRPLLHAKAYYTVNEIPHD